MLSFTGTRIMMFQLSGFYCNLKKGFRIQGLRCQFEATGMLSGVNRCWHGL